MNTHQALLLTENIDATALWLSELHQIDKPYLITLAHLDLTADYEVCNFDVIIIKDEASTMVDAVETCKHLCSMTDAPLLFMSSVDDEEYMVDVYEAGADEYIIMPINLLLFHAKLEAWLRWRVPAKIRSLSRHKATWGPFRRLDRDC